MSAFSHLQAMQPGIKVKEQISGNIHGKYVQRWRESNWVLYSTLMIIIKMDCIVNH